MKNNIYSFLPSFDGSLRVIVGVVVVSGVTTGVVVVVVVVTVVLVAGLSSTCCHEGIDGFTVALK